MLRNVPLFKYSRMVVAIGLTATMGCVGTIDSNEEIGSNAPELSWEEFRDGTYLEPWEGGAYIVDGDTPVYGEKNLREFYDALFPHGGALIVGTSGNVDWKWSATQKLNLTYCVSNTFGVNKSKVVTAVQAATADWQAAANVKYIYKSEQDGNCTASNNNVLFDVRPVSGGSYLARAFYPNSGRSARNLLLDNVAFGNLGSWTLRGVITHELGHTLGFRHEHTRPQAATCFEDDNWRELTSYDSKSVMHYPQCGGTSTGDLVLTALDKQGAASLYGAPGAPPEPDPQPNPPPSSAVDSGSVAKGLSDQLPGVAAKEHREDPAGARAAHAHSLRRPGAR